MKSQNTFSTPEAAAVADKLESLLSERTGQKLVRIDQFRGGANSSVFHVITDSGTEYLAKKYITRKGDTRDRAGTEYSGLVFLWDNGIRSVPEPVFMDSESRIGLYGYIRGRKLKPGEISSSDVEQAAVFLEKLCSIAADGESGRQPDASEACFSLRDYIKSIENRIKRLRLPGHDHILSKSFQSFMDKEFLPVFDEMKTFVEEQCNSFEMDIDRELPEAHRILSPSDFGFHNAIKRDDGSLVFIDFEYYGWDDPAKLAADFFLQPEVPLPRKYRDYFFEKTAAFLGRDEFYSKRLPLAYILLALKWCLIMLNVFVWSAYEKGSCQEACAAQLKKAKNKLAEFSEDFLNRTFPISLLKQGV